MHNKVNALFEVVEIQCRFMSTVTWRELSKENIFERITFNLIWSGCFENQVIIYKKSRTEAVIYFKKIFDVKYTFIV